MLCVSLVMLFLALSHGSGWLGEFHFADERQEKFLGSLHDYQVVHPVEVDETGAFLSHRVTQNVHRRPRRDLTKPPWQVYYKISHRGRDLLFNLTLNRLLLSPGYLSEGRWGNTTRSSVQPARDNTCHYVGSVVHTVLGGGRVALSACRGLRGLFRLPHGDYFIEPVGDHSGQEEEKQPHIVYKRHDAQHTRRKRRDASSESPGMCRVQDSTSSVLEQERRREKWEETRRKGHTISQRSVSKERWVETMVVADTKMIEYHGRENVESYIFTIINMVTALFHDPSIGNAIHIVLVRLILLEEEEEDLKIIHHGDQTLGSFCKWQKNINPKGDSSPHHHDVAVLLTRKDLCAGMNHPCETLGLSHISGMCQPHRSCNINEDSGLPLAFTIAHELGHSFGIQHDGIGNDCETFGKYHYIMSRQLRYDHSPLTWSSCSKGYITRFLDRGWGYCLNDQPTERDLKLPVVAPGVLYDVHHQCQLQYGPNSTFCDEMDNICQTLWCSVNGTCRSKLDAAADGTRCGVNKWCFNGECVTVGNRPDTIDGGWGAWSLWTHCTRTCGAGVQAAERQCSNPVPKFGGKYCIGKRRRYRVCNTEACPPDKPSFRHMQCSEFDTVLYKNSLHTWFPVYNTVNPCELHCRPVKGEFSEKMLDAVIDGTLCYEIANKRDICINGICKMIGCDYEIESKAAEDQCGVCLGDGSTCQTVTKTFEESEGLGYVDVGLIPEGARDIRVEEIAEAGNFLALRSEDPEKYFLNGGFVIQWNGDYKVAGTTFKYERNGNLENLTAPGPTKEPVWIQLLFQETNPGIRYEYTIKKAVVEENTIRQLEFSWEYGPWTSCSALCGTGVRRQIVRCVEKTSGVVEDKFCKSRTRPDNRQQKCNKPDCPARWWTGEWQKCSKACGLSGVKKRTVLCIQTVGLDEQALHVSKCKHLPRPRSQLPCNRDILCSSNWTVGLWGECSASCGGGFRTRTVNCTRPNKERCVLSKRPNARGLCALRTCPTKRKVLLPPQRPKWGKTYDKNVPDKMVPRAGPNHSSPKDEPKLNRMFSTTTTTPEPDSRTNTNKRQRHQPTDRDEKWESDKPLSGKDYNSIAFHHVMDQSVNSTRGWRAPEAASTEPPEIESEGRRGLPIEVTTQWDSGQSLVTEVGIRVDGLAYSIEDPSTKPIDSEKPTVTEKLTLVSTGTPSSLTPDVNDNLPGDIQRKPGIPGAKTDPKVKPMLIRLREKLEDLLNSRPASFVNNTENTDSSSRDRSPDHHDPNTVSITPSPGITFSDPLGTNPLSSSKSQPTVGLPTKARVIAETSLNLTADYDGFETEWKVGNWSECSTTCGVGAVWRHIECSAEGDSGCEKLRKPDPARRCFVRPCATWKIGNWSKCSENCGTGVRIRSMQCNDSHKNRPLRPFHCQLLGRKPATSLGCNLGACMEWRASAWSECSKTCGSGIQERLVYCPENDLCNLKEKPPLTVPCSAQPCTKWVPGSWGKCSVSCGGGLQHRMVMCVSTESNGTEHNYSRCQHLPHPGLVQKCNVHACVNNKGAPCVRDRMSANFCLTLKKLDRCAVATIRTQCCHTCHGASSLAMGRSVRPASIRRHTTSS